MLSTSKCLVRIFECSISSFGVRPISGSMRAVRFFGPKARLATQSAMALSRPPDRPITACWYWLFLANLCSSLINVA